MEENVVKSTFSGTMLELNVRKDLKSFNSKSDQAKNFGLKSDT